MISVRLPSILPRWNGFLCCKEINRLQYNPYDTHIILFSISYYINGNSPDIFTHIFQGRTPDAEGK